MDKSALPYIAIILVIVFFAITMWQINDLREQVLIGNTNMVSINKTLTEQISTTNSNTASINQTFSYAIGQFYDNRGLTSTIENISNSVVEIRVPYSATTSSQAAADYVDSNGNSWIVGTGFVIRNDGYILTANHVVSNAPMNPITNTPFAVIILNNGTELLATQITYPNKQYNPWDMALVKVNATLPAVQLGNWSDIRIGSKVGFIGYPLFDPVQITHDGIVSFTGSMGGIPQFTINAIVNHGNSGGPVFLEDSGKVVGIINARENLNNVAEVNIPTNTSSETRSILQTENEIISTLNSQSGIGIATPISQDILGTLPPLAAK